MAFDFGKALKVATIPIIILVVVSLGQSLIGFAATMFPPLGFALCAVAPLALIIGLVVPAWAGYKAAKAGMDLVGGALTGGLASFVAAVVGGVVNLILGIAGIGINLSSDGLPSAAVGMGFNLIAGIIGLVIAVVIGTIFGLVLGAIGAFVAQNMKK